VFGNLDCTIFGRRELCLVIWTVLYLDSGSCLVIWTTVFGRRELCLVIWTVLYLDSGSCLVIWTVLC
jgi:hypothetical protein